MSDFTNVTVCGRIGKNIRHHEIPSGKTKVTFSVAVSRRRKVGEEEWQSKTTWVPCEGWNYIADQMKQYGIPGSRITVNGEYNIDNWVDGEGQKHSKHYVNVNRLNIVNTNNNDGTSGDYRNRKSEDDEIPF